jgi:hypothetical protein
MSFFLRNVSDAKVQPGHQRGGAMTLKLDFVLLDGSYALARLPHGGANVEGKKGEFAAAITSPEGTSFVCKAGVIPEDAEFKSGFRCLKVMGTFDLEATGVLSAAIKPLADAGISLFAYSTWETDYILVHETDLERALLSLTQADHRVREN